MLVELTFHNTRDPAAYPAVNPELVLPAARAWHRLRDVRVAHLGRAALWASEQSTLDVLFTGCPSPGGWLFEAPRPLPLLGTRSLRQVSCQPSLMAHTPCLVPSPCETCAERPASAPPLGGATTQAQVSVAPC